MAYVNMGAELSAVYAFPHTLNGEQTIVLRGAVDSYPLFGLHLGPAEARALAASLVAAADRLAAGVQPEAVSA